MIYYYVIIKKHDKYNMYLEKSNRKNKMLRIYEKHIAKKQ